MPKLSKTAVAHQELFARVMAAWASDGRVNPGTRGRLANYLDNFPVYNNVIRALKSTPPVNMLDINAWVVGRPVPTREGNLFPVASAAVKVEGAFLVGTVRLALLQGEKDGDLVRATGLRFESAEERKDLISDDLKAGPPHTYPHSQPCRSWMLDGICLMHPHATLDIEIDGCPECWAETSGGVEVRTDHFNAHRPAVPLRCNTLPGLAVTALTGVYGAVVARQILDSVHSFDSMSGCSKEVVDDIEHILGEDDASGFPAY